MGRRSERTLRPRDEQAREDDAFVAPKEDSSVESMICIHAFKVKMRPREEFL